MNLLNYLSDFVNFWTFFDIVSISVLAILLVRKSIAYKHLLNECIERNALNTELKLGHLNDLKVKNDQIGSLQNDLIESKKKLVEQYAVTTHWKERALHVKHTAKPVIESKKYSCSVETLYPSFVQGNSYITSESTVKNDKKNTMWLVSEFGIPTLVFKKQFSPVK